MTRLLFSRIDLKVLNLYFFAALQHCGITKSNLVHRGTWGQGRCGYHTCLCCLLPWRAELANCLALISECLVCILGTLRSWPAFSLVPTSSAVHNEQQEDWRSIQSMTIFVFTLYDIINRFRETFLKEIFGKPMVHNELLAQMQWIFLGISSIEYTTCSARFSFTSESWDYHFIHIPVNTYTCVWIWTYILLSICIWAPRKILDGINIIILFF